MTVRTFELFLPGESDPTTVIHRFLSGVAPMKELSRNPSWPRRTLVGRAVGGELQWQRLAFPAFEEMASPHGRAKLELLREGIRVEATIELRTLSVVGWCIPATVAVAFAIEGQVFPLVFVLVFAGFIYLQIERLQRALEELLHQGAPNPPVHGVPAESTSSSAGSDGRRSDL